LEGHDKGGVAEEILRMGYIPVDIRAEEVEEKDTGPTRTHWTDRFRRVRTEELIYFSRQMALVISAGVPLLRCLQIMASQATNERLGKTLLAMAESIEGGTSLSEAMAVHPRIFSPLYIGMIRAGEASGHLDATLKRLASLGESEMEHRARMQSATRYPKLVLAALIVAFFVVVYFVIPNFAEIFKQMKAELPLPTRMMLIMNDYIQEYWLASLFMFGLGAGAVIWWVHTPMGRYWWDRLKVTMPIFGPLMEKLTLSRFSRIFSTLYASGLPILTTLELSTETLGNVYFAEPLRQVKEQVKGGQDMADSMARTHVFPVLLVQMVAVGETSGALDEVLEKVSDYYEHDIEFAIKRLSTLLEPVMLFILAGFVFFMALAVFLPMWNLTSVMTR
jgi:type II secretory pathway component PulF